MCFVLPRHDSEGRQRGSDPFRKLARALGKLEIDSPDAVGAEIGFERDGMLLLAVPVEIGLTTEHADFRSEEHTSELQSLMRHSYAVFCLTKKKKTHKISTHMQKKQNTNSPRQSHQR